MLAAGGAAATAGLLEPRFTYTERYELPGSGFAFDVVTKFWNEKPDYPGAKSDPVVPGGWITQRIRFVGTADESDDESISDETSDDETSDDESIDEISDEYTITFATGRIAKIVTNVQRKENWTHNWETLKMYFRDSETRAVAGHLFQKMFLEPSGFTGI